MKKLLCVLICILICTMFVLISCEEENAVSSNKEPTVSVTDVKLNKDALTLEKGSNEILTATVSPDDATNKDVSWSTSDDKVATVENGKVTAIGGGTATITATAEGGKTATCIVTVTVSAEKIELDKTSLQMIEGDTSNLKATFTPDDTTEVALTWSSSNANVVTVENGVVTAVGAGEATITAKTENDKAATCKVTVIANGVGFSTLQVEGTNASKKVSNATTKFSFKNEVSASGYATFVIAKDQAGSQLITEDSVSLEIGDNVFYVIETIGEKKTVYTVTIRRRAMCTITFNVDGGREIESITVEEDSKIKAPTTAKWGYIVKGWDHDFTKPITESKTITVEWEADPRPSVQVVNNKTAKELFEATKAIVDAYKNFTLAETQTLVMSFDGQSQTVVQYATEKIDNDAYSFYVEDALGGVRDIRYVTYGEGDNDNIYYVLEGEKQNGVLYPSVKGKATLTVDDCHILAGVDPEESKLFYIPESALNEIGFYIGEDNNSYYIEYMVDGKKYQSMNKLPYEIIGDVAYRLYFDSEGNLLNITVIYSGKLEIQAGSGVYMDTDYKVVGIFEQIGTTTVLEPENPETYIDVTTQLKEQIEQLKKEQEDAKGDE